MPSELTLIMKAKDLCSYVLTITEKSPKRFRFTLVGRMQNLALDIIEQAYRANEVYAVGTDRNHAAAMRLDYQHKALTCAKLLDYLALLAREQGCIVPAQYEQMTRRLSDCQNLIGAWINSDRKRLQTLLGQKPG
jgi:hypothetical protein